MLDHIEGPEQGVRIDVGVFECAFVDVGYFAHIPSAGASRPPGLNQGHLPPLGLQRSSDHAISTTNIAKGSAWGPLLRECCNECIAVLEPEAAIFNLGVNPALVNRVGDESLNVFWGRCGHSVSIVGPNMGESSHHGLASNHASPRSDAAWPERSP